MRFQVLVAGKPRPVELVFGGARDLRSIGHWRAPAAVRGQPAVRDTIEFARLASKRHRHYLRSIPTAASISEFQTIIADNPQAEVALMLLVRATWFGRSPILGLAQCRRTFCHHLVLEFLSVHPAIVGKLPPHVAGVGHGLVCELGELAGVLGLKQVWGEATAYSAPFYATSWPRLTSRTVLSSAGKPSITAGDNFAKGCSAGLISPSEGGRISAMKEKVSEAEMIRRLKEVAADEEKYFPGVLGNPVTFAGRWGLTLSKGYRDFKGKQLAAQKRRWAKSRNGRQTLRRQRPTPD